MKIEKKDNLERREIETFEVKLIEHDLKLGIHFAYIKDLGVTRDTIGNEKLVLLLQVPISQCKVAYLKTSVPMRSNSIFRICKSTSIMEDCLEEGFDINELRDELCLIEVDHHYEFCDRRTVVTEFLDTVCIKKQIGIVNVDCISTDLLPSDYYDEW